MNTRKDIKLYNLDLTGKSEFNKVEFEYNKRSTLKHNDIFVVRGGPFYKESFRLLNMQGKAYTYGEDYEFYGHLSKLTEYTNKEVGLFVRLKNENITEWQNMYQTVGNFGIIGSEILKMMFSITEDDRLIDWNDIEDKPLWFNPKPHIEDLTYEIFGFTDLTDQLYRIIGTLQDGPQIDTILLAKIQDHIQFYCDQYKLKFREIIASHDGSRLNNHSVDKEDIGLGLVDNFPIATIDELLDGTAQNRFLTPQLANRMVSEASGRNDLLYPGGSLPLLRYGNDSFIPPKIDGSFEGMGATTQRTGAIVEPTGELLVLTARYNGNTKGLYFSRCTGWDGTKPKWEFTGYQYKHPTATADGANLDFIMNGSNKYFMIIGDGSKAIYYAVETNGTFDPSKHVLKRLTGDWVTDTKYLARSTLLADSNYKDQVAILQALDYTQCKAARPSLPDNVASCGGVREIDGFYIYLLTSGSTVAKRAIINYVASDGATYNEYLFTPHLRKIISTPLGNRISAFSARFDPPLRTVWTYHGFDGCWKYNKTTGLNEMMFSYTMWCDTDKLISRSWRLKYRATLKVTQGTPPTIKMEVKPYETKLPLINPDTIEPTPDYEYFRVNKNLWTSYWAQNTDSGWCDLKNGYHLLNGFDGGVLPTTYAIAKADYYFDNNWMEEGTIQSLVPTSIKTNVEVNPLGLTSGFFNQYHMFMDLDDHNTGGIMARQMGLNGKSEWVVRKCNFSDQYYNHTRQQSDNVVINGLNIPCFPLENIVKKVNMGVNVVISSFAGASPDPTNYNLFSKERYRHLLSASAWTNINGTSFDTDQYSLNGNEAALKYGDGLLVDTNDIKLVNGVVSVIPKIVFNVRRAIDTTIRSILTSVGFTTTQLVSGWTIYHLLEINGTRYYLIRVDEIDSNNVYKMAAFTLRITGKGTPTTDRGYTYYDDVNIQQISPVKVIDPIWVGTSHPVFFQYWYNSGPLFHSGMGYFGMPGAKPGYQLGVFSTNFGALVTSGIIAEFLILEIKAGGLIERFNIKPAPYIASSEIYTCPPGLGIGIMNYGVASGGCALVSKSLDGTDGYNSLLNSIGTTNTLGMSNYIKSQWTIYFQEMKDVVLSGKNYDIPAGYIDLRTIDPSPANKTFNIYLEYYEGKVGYKIYKDVKPESASRGLIANVTCGATQINSVTPWNRFSMDGVTWNINRAGSSIPAIPGTQYEIGYPNNFLRFPEDMLPE